MTETITPDETAIPMPPTEPPKKIRNIIIKNGVICDKDELEKQQKQQEEQTQQSLQTNQIQFPYFKLNIFWLYLLLFIINILILNWSGILTGCISCFILGLILS